MFGLYKRKGIIVLDLQGKLSLNILPDEHIVEVQRKHFIAMLPVLGGIIGIVSIGVALILLIFHFYPKMGTLALVDVFVFLFSFLWAACLFTYARWFYEFYVLTNKRI